MNLTTNTAMVVILLAIILVISISLLLRKKKIVVFRSIPAFRVLNQIIGKSVEEGKALHVSLGIGSLIGRHSTADYAGLATLDNLARISLIGDKPAISTSGDGGLLILSQDVLSQNYRQSLKIALHQERYARLSGVTSAAYIAGTMVALLDEPVAGNLFIGTFDSMAVLLTSQPVGYNLSLAAADTLQAQAALFASVDESLMGEEIYAAGTYSGTTISRTASLIAQDILRWLVIIIIILGIILKSLGFI